MISKEWAETLESFGQRAACSVKLKWPQEESKQINTLAALHSFSVIKSSSWLLVKRHLLLLLRLRLEKINNNNQIQWATAVPNNWVMKTRSLVAKSSRNLFNSAGRIAFDQLSNKWSQPFSHRAFAHLVASDPVSNLVALFLVESTRDLKINFECKSRVH